MLYCTAHVKNSFNSFKGEISIFKIVNAPGQPKKVEDEKLKQILYENPYQTQLELASELGVTQQVISYRL